jgi:hypothetical protein
MFSSYKHQRLKLSRVNFLNPAAIAMRHLVTVNSSKQNKAGRPALTLLHPPVTALLFPTRTSQQHGSPHCCCATYSRQTACLATKVHQSGFLTYHPVLDSWSPTAIKQRNNERENKRLNTEWTNIYLHTFTKDKMLCLSLLGNIACGHTGATRHSPIL